MSSPELNEPPLILPCPFCGEKPEEFERTLDGQRWKQITCATNGCPGSEIGATDLVTPLVIWNRRNWGPKPSLKEKLSKVAAHCAYIQKDKVNQHQKYSYVSAAAVLDRVGEALLENRLVSVPSFRITETHRRDKVNSKGEPAVDTQVTMECTLRVHDLDSEAYTESNGFGCGQDHGDKATMKAQTAALKCSWTTLLNISTGDDPEADEETDRRATGEPTTPRQTPEEYQAKVARNATATLSPLGQKLADETEADLSPALRESLKKVREAKGLWPEPDPDAAARANDLPPIEAYDDHESTVATCDCGSPLITKMVKGQPKLFCELNDLASAYDWAVGKGKTPKQGAREAWNTVQKMHQSGEFPADAHTKFKPKV